MAVNDTIVALSTPPGIGAIAVIRISGPNTFPIVQGVFKGKNLSQQASHTLHVGAIVSNDTIIDEVVVSLFKAPHSFTKEDVIEISCHGSPYIAQKIVQLLVQQGASYAKPGAFTMRAFLNGRFNLAQAEAVADVIHADSEASHMAAINQMRGGFSVALRTFREELVTFASLLELELDFAEEDVAFANRQQLYTLITDLLQVLRPLIDSFQYGNALKDGIPVAIIGKPNAGKSTLLNTLFNEEKAIVSDIAGTTRDVIEDELFVDGIKVRFIDTAGLRTTTDVLEAKGIARTNQKIEEASLVLYVFDSADTTLQSLEEAVQHLASLQKPFLLVANKSDLKTWTEPVFGNTVLQISAAHKAGIDALKKALIASVNGAQFKTGNSLVTNMRHYDAMLHTQQALEAVLEGMDANLTTDLLAEHLREALYQLGLITGEVTNDEILGSIFSKFCIGK